MFKVSALIVLFVCGCVHSAKHLTEQPGYLRACTTSDVPCTTKSLQSLLGQIKTGIPGLNSIPKIDPLKINKVDIAQDESQPVNISAILTNAELTGMGDSVIKTAKYDKVKNILSLDLEFPKLKLGSDYSVKGRILFLQLNSQGKMYMSAENTDAKLNILTEIVEEDGERFLTAKAIRMHYKLKNVKIKMENLFNGNKELEDSANKLFNENWEELSVAFQPVLTRTAEEILLSVVRKIFHYIPVKFLFTDL